MTPQDPTQVYPSPPGEGDDELPPRHLGDFELLERLGRGGMGEVWRALEHPLRREVALKLIAPHVAASSDGRRRFLREAQTLARLQHPRVVTCYRAGEVEGRVFISLELCAAGDLDRLLASSGGRLEEARALELGRDCAEGLVALEAAGLVHRDIKPGNVFLDPEGRAKLGDMGLAREEQGAEQITSPGLVVGTPGYMSPEQASGDVALDTRSDIWALGATLFQLLAGRPPFTGGSAMSIVSQVLAADPPELAPLAPGTSPATCALVRRALARRREERFATARELLAALERALRGLRAAAELGVHEPVRPAGRRIGAPSTRRAAQETTGAERGSSRLLLGALVAALALAVGAVALERRRAALLRSAPTDPEVVPATTTPPPPPPPPPSGEPWSTLPCAVSGQEGQEGLPAAVEGPLTVDPGNVPWRGAILQGQVAGPCELRWTLSLAAEEDVGPTFEQRQEGWDARGGFLCELGVSGDDVALDDPAGLRGPMVWASLLLGRDGSLQVLVRALNRPDPGPLTRGSPGLEVVGTLAPGDFPLDVTRPLEARLVLDPRGWQLTLEQRGNHRADLGRAWGEGRAGLSPDLAARARPWCRLCNWGQGRGRGTVELHTRPLR